MKKQLISKLLAIALSLSVGTTFIMPNIYANASTISAETLDKSTKELPSNQSYIKNWEIIDEFGITHTLSMNYNTMTMTMDGETIQFTVEEMPIMTRATLDYSTAAKMSGKIPWKGSTTLLAVGITAAITGSGNAAGWAATIVGSIVGELNDVYFSLTQYKSKEKYWSSYYGTYYNKAINKNIIFRQNSQSGKILHGPVDGYWFDPIRPY